MSCKIFILSVSLLLPVMVFAQTIKPDINLTKGKVYNYQVQLKNNIAQTINGEELNIVSEFYTRIKVAVENNAATDKFYLKLSYGEILHNFQSNVLDTSITYPGDANYFKRFIYSATGKIVYTGKMENDLTGNGFDMENSLAPCRIFCEFPAQIIRAGNSWTTVQTDTIYSEALGGSLQVVSNTGYKFVSTQKINGKQYAKIAYETQLKLTGDNNSNEVKIIIKGTANRSGEMIIDATNGLLYSDQNRLDIDIEKNIVSTESIIIPISCQLSYNTKLIN